MFIVKWDCLILKIINGYKQDQQKGMGKKIENYILQTVVGSGEFGKVYKAYNQKTGQVVAIKVIQIQKFRSSPKLEEFTINQINTLSKIQDSTHIVRFIEILKTANNYYFVYEFCNEGTLEEKIKSEGKFIEEKALLYFQELLSAFKMLVKNNIMHRDIKPSNILLNNGVIKLADFGFCKPMKDSKDLAQTMLGSPIYMAPQILKGQIYTIKADIWSLGVVLYEMLYGFCPFEQRSIARLINLIDEGTVQFPSNIKISKNTEDLIKRMLIKDQFKRIQWRELFEYNLFPKEQNSGCLNHQNSKNSASYLEGQKNPNPNSTSKKQLPSAFVNNPNIQHNPQLLIANPFTKKHFQSVNSHIQVNEFNNHQLSATTSNEAFLERQNSKQRKYTDSAKQDDLNVNSSNVKKYLNNGLYAHKNSSNQQNSKEISLEKQRKRSNTVHDIRQTINQKQKQNILQYHTSSHSILQNIPNPSQISMKKAKSSSPLNISDVEKKIIQNILEKRQKILKGVMMVEKFLCQSNSKVNVSICCFIAKKVQTLAFEAEQTIQKSLKQRENIRQQEKQNSIISSSNFQVEKIIQSILEEMTEIKKKLKPFQQQLSQINEPQDIIFLRYGEQQNLTQQKQGLSQLLMIDDYLSISITTKNFSTISNDANLKTKQFQNVIGRIQLTPIARQGSSSSIMSSLNQNYSDKKKKELLEEYQKRILYHI